MRARAYDVVLNGWELGSGSIRIHRADIQERVFRLLGIAGRRAGSDSDSCSTPSATARRRTAASRSGSTASARSPPARRRFATSSRFPKTTSGLDLMMKAPSAVVPEQLRELGLEPSAPRER